MHTLAFRQTQWITLAQLYVIGGIEMGRTRVGIAIPDSLLPIGASRPNAAQRHSSNAVDAHRAFSVSTTSKSEPFSRVKLSSPFNLRSGAMDKRQSPPLSATNMPCFFSPFRIACACGGKPLMSKSCRSRNRSPRLIPVIPVLPVVCFSLHATANRPDGSDLLTCQGGMACI
jgi:hypothetical protein